MKVNNSEKSIKLNFMVNIFLNGSAYILPLLTKPYVSRILHAEGMGKVSFATSLISYFTMFAMLGVPTYGIRACARVRDSKDELQKTVQEIFLMNLILSIFVYIAFAGMLFFVPQVQGKKALLLVMSCSIILNVIGMEWFYRGTEEYVALAIRSLIFKVIAILLIFALVRSEADYIIYGFCTVIASFGSNIVNFIFVAKKTKFKPVSLKNIQRHLKPTLVFFAMSVATTIYTNLDVVMLEFMTTDAQVGYYDATLTIKLILIGAVSSLGAVMLPRVSYYIEKNLYNKFIEVSKRAFNCILLMAIPLVVYFFTFSEEVIMLMSGKGFEGAILPMKILIPTILFIGLTNISGIQMLVPLGKEKIVLYSEIGGAIVDLCINLVLIPKMGAFGAAIGTLIAEIVVLLIQFLSLRIELKEIFKYIEWWKILICGLIAVIPSVFIRETGIQLFIKLVVSVMIYFGVYFIMLFVVREKEFMSLIENVKSLLRKGEK